MDIAYKIEETFLKFEHVNSSDRKKLQLLIRDYIQEYIGLDKNETLTLAETIASISRLSDSEKTRDISMIILHGLSIAEIFQSKKIDAVLIELLDKTIPDIYRKYEIKISDQTYIKIEQLSLIHNKICENLNCLKNIDSTIDSILSMRQNIQKALNDKTLKAYTRHLGYTAINDNLTKIFSLICYYKDDKEIFFENLDVIEKNIEEGISYCTSHKSFFTEDYYKKFLTRLKDALINSKSNFETEFNCVITTGSENETTVDVEKKYPLHLKNSTLNIMLPLKIIGKGIARDVRGEISTNTDDAIIESKKFSFGDIKSRTFTIPVQINIRSPIKTLTIDIIIEWGITGQRNNDKQELFEFKLKGQNPDIDWDYLEHTDPYSLEVVSGNKFIGRKDIIRRIWKRLASPTVTSSYITGQKRVGKSSLANAIIEYGKQKDENYKFISFEYGEYGNKTAEKTLNYLGELLIEELKYELPPKEISIYENIQLDGSLPLLIRLVRRLEETSPNRKFVIILDEFDEINYELYRMGQLADTFFSNLRALSSKKNIGFLLVGSERMNQIMGSQGDQLNKFSPESLNNFDIGSELQDYEDLIRQPVKGYIEWHNDAIYSVYNQTSGHPYFTNLICSHMIEKSILLKDCEITRNEVESCLDSIISRLEMNSFSHFWKDGIDGDHEEQQIIELKRCRVLVGYAQAHRLTGITNLETIYQNMPSNRKMSEDETKIILQEFCFRQIMELDSNCNYTVKLKLFEFWLIEKGVNTIIIDQLGDEIENAQKKVEENAFVKSSEISELTKKWPLYRGQKITSEDVRAWLQQEKKSTDQRILFTILQNLRFPSELEINSMLALAHARFEKDFAGYIQTHKQNRRADILVTYVDGVGKSGSYYSTKYCQENKLSVQSNYELSSINKELARRKGNSDLLRGLVIVDDFIGTGDSLSSNVKSFIEVNYAILHETNIPIKIMILFSTREGEEKVRNTIAELSYKNIDIYICEIIEDRYYAFKNSINFWQSEDEKIYAKSLCLKHGKNLSKPSPLGYAEQGMLFLSPRNCPNNTLTLLHSSMDKESYKWEALFPRIKA